MLGCKSFRFQAQHGFFSFAKEISLFHFSALFSLQGRQAPLRRWRSPIRKEPPSESAGILDAQRVALSLGSQSNEGASEPRLRLVGGGNYRRGNMGRGRHTQCGAWSREVLNTCEAPNTFSAQWQELRASSPSQELLSAPENQTCVLPLSLFPRQDVRFMFVFRCGWSFGHCETPLQPN